MSVICLRHLPLKLLSMKIMVRHNSAPILMQSSATFSPQTKNDSCGHNSRKCITFDAYDEDDDNNHYKSSQIDLYSLSNKLMQLNGNSLITNGNLTVNLDETHSSLAQNSRDSPLIDTDTTQRSLVPVTVLNGFLDANPISVYCINGKYDILNSKFLSDCEKRSVDWDYHNRTLIRMTESHKLNIATQNNNENSGKPNAEQLHWVFEELANSIPSFFTRPHNYRVYNQNVEFRDNIRGVTTYGLKIYTQQIAMIKILGHLKYSHIKMEILKITEHPEDGTVRVRWRVIGVPGLRKIVMFWKYRLWEWKKLMSKSQADWIDGFSIFHVGSDGLVYKHVVDKIIPDDQRNEAKAVNGVAMKLALLLGLIARPDGEFFDDLPILMQISSTQMSSMLMSPFGNFDPNG